MGRVVQITPSYPPEVSGVGDYAAILQGALHDFGIAIETIVASKAPPPNPADGVLFVPPEAAALKAALEPASRVLLHFSGYGYHHHGLCNGLVEALTEWRSRSCARHLVTLFHEVFASGPVWKRSFWTAPRQRDIARRLAAITDVCFVSSDGGAHRLQQVAPGAKADLLPVFSNFGELSDPPELAVRQPIAVVLGTLPRRTALYAALRQRGRAGQDWLSAMGVNRILDIGGGEAVGDAANLPVHRLGRMAAKDISEVLATARVGLIDYPDRAFSKSGVAAAYLAHGMLVANTRNDWGIGTLAGRAYAVVGTRMDAVTAQHIARQGFDWYSGHRLANTARQIVRALAR